MDLAYLKKRVIYSEMHVAAIAKTMKLTRSGLANKLNGKRGFTVDEINTLCEIIGIGEAEKFSIINGVQDGRVKM